jgi:hypothetical protein
VHAEARAIREAYVRCRPDPGGLPPLDGLELLHAKIAGPGQLVAGGPPSCWQCSREILDAGLAAVWLFESIHGGRSSEGIWRRYTAKEFHEVTWRNVELAEAVVP